MKKIPLNTQIIFAAILGVTLGLILQNIGKSTPWVENVLYLAKLIGSVFIDLLKMVLIPLVFCSIVVGVSRLRIEANRHKIWIVTMIFFALTMSIAIFLGLGTSNLFEPGKNLNLSMFSEATSQFATKDMSMGQFSKQFLDSLIENPFSALANGNILASVVFALFLGIALVSGGHHFDVVTNLFEKFMEIMMFMIGWIMKLAPIGIMALLMQLLASQDVKLLTTLLKFIVIVIGTTLVHGVIILPLILYFITKISPWKFWQGAKEALITAFATSSSAATLPITLNCVTHNFGVKPEIGNFVVPIGATINMDGTALYEAAAALFIANLAGIELSFAQQMVVFLMSMIAAMGAPGIPSAGMVTMVMVLQSVGLPAEAIAILLPIDRILDTFRTMVNVEGDLIGSLVVDQIVNKRS